MGNEVTAQAGTRAAVGLPAIPDHLKAAMAAAGEGNIRAGASTNTLSFGGKAFKFTVNGESKVAQKWDEEAGMMVNQQVIQLVVLDQSDRGRRYYEKGYDPDNPSAPDCWSQNGKAPHASVEVPVCSSCGACPKSIKGSRVVEGREMIACSGFRLLSVQPVKMIEGRPVIAHDFPPMRMTLPPTSIWDEQDEESANAGWYGWDNFTKLMRANGAQWTNASVVRVRPANTDFAKVQFARGDYLSAEDFARTRARAQQDDVKAMLQGWTSPRTEDGAPTKGKPLPKDEEPRNEGAPPVGDPVFSQSGAAAEAAQAAEIAKAIKDAQVKALYDAEVAKKAAEAKKAADAKAKKIAEARRLLAEAEAAEGAPAAVDNGGFDDVAPTAPAAVPAPIVDTPAPPKNTAKAAPPAAPAAAPAEVPAALATILGDWE